MGNKTNAIDQRLAGHVVGRFKIWEAQHSEHNTMYGETQNEQGEIFGVYRCADCDETRTVWVSVIQKTGKKEKPEKKIIIPGQD